MTAKTIRATIRSGKKEPLFSMNSLKK
jgi:hypothetical protein